MGVTNPASVQRGVPGVFAANTCQEVKRDHVASAGTCHDIVSFTDTSMKSVSSVAYLRTAPQRVTPAVQPAIFEPA